MNLHLLTSLLVLLASATLCPGYEPDTYAHVVLFPTNLAAHGVSFSYHTNASAVEIRLPSKVDGAAFKWAMLFAQSGDRYDPGPGHPRQNQAQRQLLDGQQVSP